jgi:hypothetical protein
MCCPNRGLIATFTEVACLSEKNWDLGSWRKKRPNRDLLLTITAIACRSKRKSYLDSWRKKRHAKGDQMASSAFNRM